MEEQPTAVTVYTNPQGEVIVSDASGKLEFFVLTPQQAEIFGDALKSKAVEAINRQKNNS
jgi:hypothetical protein